MAGYDEIEFEYIKEELSLHSEYLEELFSEAIDAKDLKDTGELQNAITRPGAFKIYKDGGQMVLSMQFPDYGRFIEIQSSKKRKIKTQTSDVSAAIWGLNSKQPKKKKGKNAQWYTRNIFGAQNRLIGRLMWGLSDIERKKIAEKLNIDNQIEIKL